MGKKCLNIESSDGSINVSRVCNCFDLSVASAPLGYTEYVAVVSQSGTSDPVDSVLVNTLGVNITWSRTGLGDYVITASSPVFTVNRTTFQVGPASFDNEVCFFGSQITSTTTISLSSIDATTINNIDSALAQTTVVIRVY